MPPSYFDRGILVHATPPEPPTNIRFTALPQFAPVEALFPGWVTARTTIAGFLPACVSFDVAPDDPHKIEISSAWAMHLYYAAPAEDRALVIERLNIWLQHIAESENMAAYGIFVGAQMAPRTLAQINAMFQDHERHRRAQGWHTMHQALYHFMGLRSAMPITVITSRLAPGSDTPGGRR